MELTNKQLTYSVSHQSAEFKMTGSVHINEMNRITNLNGNLYKDDEYSGDFYYSESEEGKVNKSINGVTKENVSAACNFIVEIVNLIKSELDK